MLKGTALALVALLAAPLALAQNPPLIRLVVPFPPGGSNDVIARAMAPQLAKRLGTNVIVENKSGAAGVIGSDAVAKAAPDGSHLLLTSSTFLTTAATQAKLPYDPLAALIPVAMVAEGPLLVAVPAERPIRTPADLVAAAKAKPGALNYGTAGVGSLAHLATELLNGAANIQMTHVPYKGAGPALIDLAAGQIDVMISNYSSLVSQMKAGKVRAIAVTSPKPSPAFPELPPIGSAVPGYAMDIWVTVFAPAGTPAALIERLNKEINGISASPELRTFLDPDGAQPVAMPPAAIAARMKQDLAQLKRIAAERKISLD
ncbi:MAG TPA: tripartite tricarboxylate transporter substrate binding protein [Burkholderiales bacterium]|nr:tripartite tricarboxylate transporter substrate binding protein [Burkholderiales bacterium]